MPTNSLNTMRRIALGALAFSVSLPIGFITASKILLVVAGVIVFWQRNPKPLHWQTERPIVNTWVYASFLTMLVSVLWTQAPDSLAWKSINHHGTLLLIPLIYFVLKTKDEARSALRLYLLGQLLVLFSSWALFAGQSLPWQSSDTRSSGNQYATFSSYLDQSIMASVFSAVLWHGRHYLAEGWLRYGVVPVCSAALVCVFFLLPGRTGQLVGLAMLSLWIMWLLPARVRLAAICVPVVLTVGFLVFSKPVHDRFETSWTEARAYAQGDASPTSIGFRLEAWRSALVSIRENPLVGTGAGSWGRQYDAIQSEAGRPNKTPTDGNPHQEFLLWGVELGVGGMVLLSGILGSIFLLSLRMDTGSQRATQSTLVATIISCLFNCALYDALIGDYLCVTLALCLGSGLKPDAEHVQQNEVSVQNPSRAHA